MSNFLRFMDRQAGISLIYDPDDEKYYYNVYCIETTLMKEIFTVEFEFLADAIETANGEFGQWELISYEKKKEGCSSCSAK